jgi:spermidine synthase
VLVIGGGDGGTVREVLRHPSVEKCSLVEIDELVVNACREHIPQTAACLSDPRVEVLITDGVEFVRKTKRKFDIIIVDSTDPIGAAAPLFGQEFYKNVTSALTLGGIVVSQAASPFYEKETQLSMLEIQQSLFKNVHMFNFSNLSYPGGLWSFSYASQTCCPIEGLDSKRVNDLALEFYYYNESVHKAAFCLPSFMSRGLEAHLSPLPKEGV